MKKLLLPLLFVFFIETSCGGPDPGKFNDAVVDLNESVAQIQSNFDSKLQDAIDTYTFDSIPKAVDNAVTNIDANIAKLKQLKVPSGGEKMIESSLVLFQAVRNTVSGAMKFTELVPSEVTGEISYEEFSVIFDEYDELSEKASIAAAEMGKTQEIFAKEKSLNLTTQR